MEVFPLDTELHREIGAAVDTEMHRELTREIAAATVEPGTALDPDVAAVHEKVAAVPTAATTGVSKVTFEDTAASYASFTNLELLRCVVGGRGGRGCGGSALWLFEVYVFEVYIPLSPGAGCDFLRRRKSWSPGRWNLLTDTPMCCSLCLLAWVSVPGVPPSSTYLRNKVVAVEVKRSLWYL